MSIEEVEACRYSYYRCTSTDSRVPDVMFYETTAANAAERYFRSFPDRVPSGSVYVYEMQQVLDGKSREFVCGSREVGI